MNKEQIIEYGKRQIEELRKIASIDDNLFDEFIEQTRQEQEKTIKGTLTLEKEKKPRAVDKFVYAGYYRVSVDIFGEYGISTGLYLRAYNAQPPGTGVIIRTMNEIARFPIQWAQDYGAEMNNDPEKIVKDICGFIGAINKKAFPQLAEPDPLKPVISKFVLVYLRLWDMITYAAEACNLIAGAPEQLFQSGEEAIHQAIMKTAIRISGEQPPETPKLRFNFILEELSEQGSLFVNAAQEPDTEPRTDIISIAAKRAKEIQYPTDKINYMAFNLPGRKDINGQLRFDGEFKINVGKRGEPATVLYNIQFSDNDVSISQKLEPYDKRVQIAAGTLWKEYGEYFTLKQLYHAMGNDGQPGAGEFKKMLNSMKKQLTAEIQITNEDEAKKQKRRAKFVYSGALLPYETITAEVNGKIQDGVIHLLREPPLIEFARQRKQITTIPRAVLTTPISQTNDNLAIEDYVIERINMMKHDQEKNRKILIKSVNEHCLITATKQKQRTKDKILKLLDYYTKIGYIKGFEQLTDAFLLDI